MKAHHLEMPKFAPAKGMKNQSCTSQGRAYSTYYDEL